MVFDQHKWNLLIDENEPEQYKVNEKEIIQSDWTKETSVSIEELVENLNSQLNKHLQNLRTFTICSIWPLIFIFLMMSVCDPHYAINRFGVNHGVLIRILVILKKSSKISPCIIS